MTCRSARAVWVGAAARQMHPLHLGSLVTVVGVVGLGRVAGVEVGVVGVAAAGEGDVGQVAAGGVGQHRMGGIGGDALGGVHGDRMPELHLLTEVVVAEDRPRFVAQATGGQARMRGVSSTLTTCQRCPLRTGASNNCWVRSSGW